MSRLQVYRSLSNEKTLLDDYLAVGESSMPRNEVLGANSQTSQVVRICFFTPRRSEVINGLTVMTSGTAAGATPTLVRVGIYEADVDADSATFSLVASIVNDTTIFAAANTRYTRALSTPWNKRAGARCGVGVLVVTAAALPTVAGSSAMVGLGNEYQEWPWIGGSITGQADLPASFTSGSLTASAAGSSRPYVRFNP